MFFRSASFCASSVMNLSASLPVPPYGVNTRGLNEPCSISITRWLYVRFFSFSLLLKAVSSFWFRWLFANGLNTLTSKNAFCPFCQKPRALKSNRTSSDELALLLSTSLVSVSRCGSTSTSTNIMVCKLISLAHYQHHGLKIDFIGSLQRINYSGPNIGCMQPLVWQCFADAIPDKAAIAKIGFNNRSIYSNFVIQWQNGRNLTKNTRNFLYYVFSVSFPCRIFVYLYTETFGILYPI